MEIPTEQSIAFITGASSGIGKGIAQALLDIGLPVRGLQRRAGIEHPRYVHEPVDLLQPEAVEAVSLHLPKGIKCALLINNAGVIAPIAPADQLPGAAVRENIFLNLTVPILLTQRFLALCAQRQIEPTVVFISSGAAKYPIPSWSVYCAAKAGLEQYIQVLHVDKPELACLAISPGIVDTAMQEDIRGSKAADFPDHQRFVDYKEKGELQDPMEVGKKIAYFALHPQEAPQRSFSLRDI